MGRSEMYRTFKHACYQSQDFSNVMAAFFNLSQEYVNKLEHSQTKGLAYWRAVQKHPNGTASQYAPDSGFSLFEEALPQCQVLDVTLVPGSLVAVG